MEQNELIFGIKRFINKIRFYSQTRTCEELLNDQLSFDAICYCLIMLNYCLDQLDEKMLKELNLKALKESVNKAIKIGEYINIEILDKLLANIIPNINI